MKPAVNINNPLVVTHLFSILNNITDAGMRAASDNDQSLTGMVHQSRIINNLVPLIYPLFLAKGDGFFKIILAGDFSQECQFKAEIFWLPA